MAINQRGRSARRTGNPSSAGVAGGEGFSREPLVAADDYSRQYTIRKPSRQWGMDVLFHGYDYHGNGVRIQQAKDVGYSSGKTRGGSNAAEVQLR